MAGGLPRSLILEKNSRFVTVALSSVAVNESSLPTEPHELRPLATARTLRACRGKMGERDGNVRMYETVVIWRERGCVKTCSPPPKARNADRIYGKQ